MSVRNRASMAGYGNRRSTGMFDIMRWLLGVIALGVVSFVIGFFVIARMIPSGPQADAESRAGTPAGRTDTGNATSHAATTPVQQPSRPPMSAPRQSVSTTPNSFPGPSIDPANDDNTRQANSPDNMQQSLTPSASSQSNDPAGGTLAGSPSKPNTDPSDTSSTSRHRRHRRHSKDQDTVQPPANPDGDTPANKTDNPDPQTPPTPGTTPPPDTQHTGASTPTTPPAAGPYRVQFGVFSTREAAEQEAQHVKDKGFRASVHTYTQDGRTLYRVQNGVFKDRDRAETARQRLSDAGLDASLSTP